MCRFIPFHYLPDGRIAVLVSSSVSILEYPGEEYDPFVRCETSLHEERRMVDCGTVKAQVSLKISFTPLTCNVGPCAKASSIIIKIILFPLLLSLSLGLCL